MQTCHYILINALTVHVNSLMCFLWHRAGRWLWRLLQDGLAPQVGGQRAVRPPDCKLPVNAHFDHLFLPRDGDVPCGKFSEELPVGVLQLHAFNGGEGPHVINVLGVNGLGVWQKRGSEDPCRDASCGERDAIEWSSAPWQPSLRSLQQTCIQFPPVDVAEESMSPELITGAVLEAEPLVDLSDQQPIADGAGLLTELLWVGYWIVQDPLL